MSDVSDLLLGTATRVFADHAAPAVQQKEVCPWQPAFWDAIEHAGLGDALVGEASGGAGLSLAEAFRIVDLAAYEAIALPLGETMLARWLLDRAGISPPAGPLPLVTSQEAAAFEVRSDPGGWRANGVLHDVPYARHAKAIAVVISSASGARIALLDIGATRITESGNLANEPRDSVWADATPAILAPAPLAPAEVYAVCTVMRTVQIAAACRKALDFVTEYANTRIQFGRPLAKLQIIQQYVAVMATETAAADGAAGLGLDALEPDFDSFGVGCAKIRASEAAGKVASLAHQIFGAIGFAREHPLHLTTRRLWSWRDEFGSESEWSRSIGSSVFAANGNSLWTRIAT